MLKDSAELVDPPDGSDHTNRPCPVSWCKATKKIKLPPTWANRDAERYTYGECRDSRGEYAGLVHVARLEASSDSDDGDADDVSDG